MEKQEILNRIKNSMMVLVGIGTEISEKYHTREELLAFYQEIAEAVKGKFYFVVTLNTDDLIYEAVSHIIGLREKRRFEIKLPSELIVVNVDGKLMVQVLVNLLDNAMKHTGENGWICIEARYDAGKVWIRVEDDGDGIPEDLKENIFDEFVTRSDEKGDRQRGIGLGLAICKAVVNAHGGNICAENRKEGGARFMFWLEARQVSTDGR